MAKHLGRAPILVLCVIGTDADDRVVDFVPCSRGIDEATCRRPKGHDGEHSAMARTGAAPLRRRRRAPGRARPCHPPLLPEGA